MANKHISYRQFKNIFGDLGVTYWTKYNWLSNGLPDGEYNGITKVTFNGTEPNWHFWSNGTVSVLYMDNNFAINPSSNNERWQYGFSNWNIGKGAGETEFDTYISFSIEPDHMNLIVKGLSTRPQMIEYLKEHPIQLYYYDKNKWKVPELDDVALEIVLLNVVSINSSSSITLALQQDSESNYFGIRGSSTNVPGTQKFWNGVYIEAMTSATGGSRGQDWSRLFSNPEENKDFPYVLNADKSQSRMVIGGNLKIDEEWRDTFFEDSKTRTMQEYPTCRIKLLEQYTWTVKNYSHNYITGDILIRYA